MTHSFANSLKRVVVIMSSILFFRTPISPINALGTELMLSFIQAPITGHLIYLCLRWRWREVGAASGRCLLLRFLHLLCVRWSLRCQRWSAVSISIVKMGVVLQFQILYIAKLVLKLKLPAFFLLNLIYFILFSSMENIVFCLFWCVWTKCHRSVSMSNILVSFSCHVRMDHHRHISRSYTFNPKYRL